MFNIKKRQFSFYIVLVVVILSGITIYTIFLKSFLNDFAYKSAVSEAQRSAEQLLTTRGVIANLSPHVKVIDDEVSRFAFTPAAVGIAISNAMKDEKNYYIKQTTMVLRNQANKPDQFEKFVLKKMEKDNISEFSQRVDFNGVDSLRYGKALYIDQSCMRCHGKPYVDVPADIYKSLVDSYGDVSFNYKVGELRGIISIAVPMDEFNKEYENIFKITIIGSIALMIILLILFYFNNKYIIKPHIKLLDKSNEELESIAFLDLLTNIPNRRAFHKHLNDYIADDKSFWLLLLDLDGFKAVNDNLGHDAGDIVLKVFSERISQMSKDIELYRLGGDEFTVVVSNNNRQDEIAEITAEIIKLANIPISVGDDNAKIGVSIGAVHRRSDAREYDLLIKYGDMAMYGAKEAGKNQTIFFTKELLAGVNSIKQLEKELSVALENDEFFLVYQPQYNYKEKKIVGTEALLRWEHPTRGIISPDHFIDIAEDTGLIKEIGEWILFEAIRQNKTWQDSGYQHITMSVNVTSVQLNDFGFIMNLIDVINDTRIDPKYIEIEFIERDAISNEGQAVEFMEQLKRFKISSAIDDFGTGYSSLSYITKYPIKKIKIDRLFITDIDTNNGHQAIVKSILSIASHLDMKIVAEGVERQEELDFLMEQGCYTIQGYLYSKPINAKKMGDLLNNNEEENNE